MTELWQPTAEPLVLHVIPTPVARGAQREARALADRLDDPGRRAHRVLTLFEGPDEVDSDFSLGYGGGGRAGTGFDPRVVLPLRSALARLDPALVIAHGGEPLKYLVPALAGRRRPLVYYAIGTFAGSQHPGAQRLLWRRLVARVDRVAAEGHEVRRQCIGLLGVPEDHVVMTPNGRDPEHFHPGMQPRVSTPKVLTFVGALTAGKRPDRFIEVVSALRQQGYSFRARLVGDGPLRDSLRPAAHEADVELLGARSDVAELLQDTDILVFPSRPTGEGMPGVLIEAGLSGVPVVATDVPGVSTIVAHGETGVVVADDDLTALVAATANLLDDDARRTAMGEAARSRCVAEFGLDAVAAQWSALLTPLIPSSGTVAT
jgi:glycosyltransferase involved in cell wall biosynthesis